MPSQTIQHSIGNPSHRNQTGKKHKINPIKKEEVKLSLFVNDSPMHTK